MTGLSLVEVEMIRKLQLGRVLGKFWCGICKIKLEDKLKFYLKYIQFLLFVVRGDLILILLFLEIEVGKLSFMILTDILEFK